MKILSADLTMKRRRMTTVCGALLVCLLCLQVGQAQKPELVIQTGHSNRINAVAFSPDGRLLATGGVDQTVKLWDVTSGLELRTLRAHKSAVQTLAFSPDGLTLASGGTDADIHLHEVSSGRRLRTLVGHEATVTSLAFSPDGRILVSAGMDQIIRVWEAATGGQLQLFVTDEQSVFRGFVTMSLNRDGRTIASGGEITKLWDAATGRELRTVRGRLAGAPPAQTLVFSPDGNSLLVSGKKISLLDVLTGRTRWELQNESNIGIESLIFSPDGKFIAGAGEEITLWDAVTGRELKRVLSTTDRAVLAFGPDSRTLAVASGSTKEFAIQLLDVTTGQEVRKLDGRTSPISSVAFSPDGRWLANGRRTNIARTDTVKLWDLLTGQLQRTLSGNRFAVRKVAFSADSRTLASGGGLEMRLWDTATGQEVKVVNENPRNIDALAFSADGKMLASGERNGTIKLSEAATGRQLHLLKGHSDGRFGGVNALAFSPDGKMLASGGQDKVVRLWDTATGQELRTLPGHADRVYAITFSPDGRLIASGGLYQPVRLWDVQTAQMLRTLPMKAGLINFRLDALAFSPDGRSLAGAVVPLLNEAGGALVWDVATGNVRHQLTGATSVSSIAYSPDGRLIAGGSETTAICLWDAQSGSLLAQLLALDEQDWLVVTPDGLFDGSPAAWNQILWRFSPQLNDVAPVESFFNEFYYPGLLNEFFAGKRPKAALNLEQKDRRPPQLKMSVDGSTATALTTRRVKVRLDITQAPAGAQDVRLFRNGSLVKAWRGDVLKGQRQVTLDADIQIAAGANRLSAYAFNRDNVKSADATLVVNGADSLKRTGIAYLLAIGVNQYANPKFNLRFAVADATDFAAEFEQQQMKLKRYERIEAIPLYDQNATRENILQALTNIAAKAQPEDAVIVYFAGHGTALQQQFYLIPHDLGYRGDRRQIDTASLKLILSRSVSDRELERAFETIDAGQLLLVIDACNSGQALEAAEKRRGPMNSKGLAQLAYEKGMYVMTASQSYQAAIEPADLKHGLLTYTLVEEGLKRAAADIEPKDGTVLLREWLNYATERVPQLQRERMRQAGTRKLILAYVEEEERVNDAEQRNVQRPRVFYRRELEAQPFVIAATKE